MTESSKGDASGHSVAWNFAATILLSAFLLFQVQPLISKYILPWFGGSPGVWTTCLVFFQVVLFCGYAYAHFTSRFLSRKAQAALHLVLIGLAVTVLVVVFSGLAPIESWKPADASNPELRILLLLGATVGLPYFVLSSTGPLVQAWFSHTYPGKSPYRLYALSNIGSLVALLSYPFFFEVQFDVGVQSLLWSAAFALFGLLCGWCAMNLWRLSPPLAIIPLELSGEPAADRGPPTLLRRALWLVLPAVGTLTLIAVTDHATQDVAPNPILWLIPLSLYLISFIICFDHPRWYQRVPFSLVTGLLIFVLAGIDYLPEIVLSSDNDFSFDLLQEVVLCFVALFGVCMVCHGELVRLRPSPRHLTEYYLMISAGGALGGIFVSLIAPRVFNWRYEWKLSLELSLIICAAVWCHAVIWPLRASPKTSWRALLVRDGALAAVGLFMISAWQTFDSNAVHQARNFYGIVWVRELEPDDPQQHYYAVVSGTTGHGRQYAAPEKRRRKTGYYSERAGAGRAILHHAHKPDLRVGVVGMGIGTLAAYAELPSHYFRFYEINPEMEKIATGVTAWQGDDPKSPCFSYLADCRGKVDIVMGDARIALDREPEQQFDVLVLDAFSGDSVPIHLLTKEAFDIYLRHLKPDGIIVVHITNHTLNLAPVVQQMAALNDLGITRIHHETDSEKLIYFSDYLLLTKDEKFLAANPATIPLDENPQRVRLWTDRYSNLWQVLIWNKE